MAVLRNASTNVRLSTEVERARTPWQRTVGLLLRTQIRPAQGVWLEHCTAIHTMGMRSAVDVMFLGRDGRVIHTKARVRPYLPVVWFPGTKTVVEMGPGFLDEQKIVCGDRLELL